MAVNTLAGGAIRLSRVNAFAAGAALLIVGYTACYLSLQHDTPPKCVATAPSSLAAKTPVRGAASKSRVNDVQLAPASKADAASCVVSSPKQLEFPEHINRLIINVGSYRDPPMPPDEHTAVLAVEPLLHTANLIPKAKDLFILTSAVSNFSGLAQFHVYNGGASSSLSRVTDPDSKPWAQQQVNVESQVLREGDTPFFVVPVITMHQLLSAIPESVKISYLKIDLQGWDLTAAMSAGELLRRAKKVQAEVYCSGYESYEGVNNRAEDWEKHMKQLNFELVEGGCGGAGEFDMVWKRVGSWP